MKKSNYCYYFIIVFGSHISTFNMETGYIFEQKCMSWMKSRCVLDLKETLCSLLMTLVMAVWTTYILELHFNNVCVFSDSIWSHFPTTQNKLTYNHNPLRQSSIVFLAFWIPTLFWQLFLQHTLKSSTSSTWVSPNSSRWSS